MTAEGTPGGSEWRLAQAAGLLAFAAGSAVERGFGWLGPDGEIDESEELQLWISARMTYVFSMAHQAGHPDTLGLAEHGVRTLSSTFHDQDLGGWFHRVGADGRATDATKSCYDHSFVVLAASAAVAADVTGAGSFLEQALDTHIDRFWEVEAGRCRESWNREWAVEEPYRGANSNMHAVESYLLAAQVTGDADLLLRALSIAEHLVLGDARLNGWRVVEHFDPKWVADLEYNRDRPDDPFRPYGATPGHGFEWARLLLQLEDALKAHGRHGPAWLPHCAQLLFVKAVADTRSGVNGFCYTTDWTGKEVVAERFHWVAAEAILAAEAVATRFDDEFAARLAKRWWHWADDHFIDHQRGSWHHELDADLKSSSRTWHGKPDAYHVWNLMTLRESQPWSFGQVRRPSR